MLFKKNMYIAFFLFMFVFSEIKSERPDVLCSFDGPMYFVTVADTEHYPWLIGLLNSINKHNANKDVLTLIFDIGLKIDEIKHIERKYRTKVYPIEMTNKDITKKFVVRPSGRLARGWYAWKPVAMKQALELVPYCLYIDSGISLAGPPDDIFNIIIDKGYFLFDCGHDIGPMTTQKVRKKFQLDSPENCWILNQFGVAAGAQGISRKIYDDYIKPIYLLAHHLEWFEDDGSAPWGFGGARHDQVLFSIHARKLGYFVHRVYGDGPRDSILLRKYHKFYRNNYFRYKEYKENPRAKENHLM